MSFHLWLAFSLSTFLICFSPGPNMLHMLATSAKYGLRRTCFSMLGCFTAVALMIAASIAGVGAILSTSPRLFMLLRYAGAAYLLYLGIKAWRSPTTPLTIDAQAHIPHQRQTTPAQLLQGGFLIGISNPKALLFAGAFFPQFMSPALPQLPQLGLLFITFTLIEFSCYTLYATCGRKLAKALVEPSMRRLMNRVMGVVFSTFSFLLVFRYSG